MWGLLVIKVSIIMRDLGLLGENAFSSWCHQVGLIPNPSIIDKTGWDFYVQFPQVDDLSVSKLHKSIFECKVQVKATDKRERKLAITLSNLRQLATSQMPSFYVFLEFDGKNEVQKAFILHLDNNIIYSILERIHKIEQNNKKNNLNKRTMTLKYDESNELELLDGQNLKENLLAYIGEDYSKYINEKAKFLETCGFEDGYGTIQFSLSGEDSIKKIIDVSLGLEEELDVENLVSIEQRFGIPSKNPEFELKTAKLKLGMLAPKKGKIHFKEDQLSSGLTFDMKFYISPFSFQEFRKFSKFRIIGEFFDISCEPYQNKANYNFSLGDDFRWEIKELKKAITLITLLSKDEHRTIFDIELENSEILSFTLTSKYVKRDLEIFDDLLNKILQIHQNLPNHNEISISLKELYYYKQEIEQFHTLVTKTCECNFKVEFGLNVEDHLRKNQIVHISVTTSRLGSHIVGAIFSVVGKPTVISENRYRLECSEIEIERVFVFTPKNKSINENIQETIDQIILKYDQKYDVVYNWGQ